jgi:COX assembly mitochondrial protein 2
MVGCEEVMTALEECHAKGFLWKSMGMCSDLKTQVNKCLRAERLERTAKNREQAKERRAKMKAIWSEIDANS